MAPRAPSIFVAFAFTRTPILKPFAIENSVIAAIKSNEPNVQNQKRGQADKGQSCVYHVPAYRSITYCLQAIKCALTCDHVKINVVESCQKNLTCYPPPPPPPPPHLGSWMMLVEKDHRGLLMIVVVQTLMSHVLQLV